ncbi:UDP-2,4-diacetamido-2,4,6-trideoxy-beta-L-altropyranose hydrolase [Cytophagaceae bacterium DM2B3-1]|uniref:UDP-2,4-diacetamido-2,4, 6-trideoxy-beta-L-altropyranose hydrolase n=1 Tax=Xanthocytophaga flava TaxID=3048013 RepID=A0ABT7CDH5_9BACT|nr:UDP-2,4-diacetamido-2,4,6-trideoxy-beta-L-altropyranose hydrolase [Xanthocytophaga flavus]MDJ1491718.1 UDP-2,4-diacetamido-2,4,6-trideoxy-beta-L-altropyranose hydrolase [Xanthocytophaga flavus]
MNKIRVIFRADGNAQIGLGHVTRSLALADMLRDDFECIFAIQQPSDAIRNQILEVCTSLIELPLATDYIQEATALLSRLQPTDIIVLDGYGFETLCQRVYKQAGHKLVCIDDIHAYHFVADVVVNQAGHINPSRYSHEIYTQLCIGPEQYALLRKPFLEKIKENRSSFDRKKLFISFGGGDNNDFTYSITKQVVEKDLFDEIVVLVGSAYPYMQNLQLFSEEHSHIKIYQNIDADQVSNLMHSCMAAICAPSSVAYEYCAVGGLLFLKQTANNQLGIVSFLINEKMAYIFDEQFPFITSETAIEQDALAMMQSQRRYFTGKSNKAFLKLFKNLAFSKELKVRSADDNDLLLFFQWANDPEIRKYSYNSNPIELEVHKKWFQNKLLNSNSIMYVVSTSHEPIAQIRFEVDKEEAIISYLIDNKYRGKGLGVTVLLLGIQAVKATHQTVARIIGYVIKENIASCKAFERAGFNKDEADSDIYPNSYKYILSV